MSYTGIRVPDSDSRVSLRIRWYPAIQSTPWTRIKAITTPSTLSPVAPIRSGAIRTAVSPAIRNMPRPTIIHSENRIRFLQSAFAISAAGPASKGSTTLRNIFIICRTLLFCHMWHLRWICNRLHNRCKCHPEWHISSLAMLWKRFHEGVLSIFRPLRQAKSGDHSKKSTDRARATPRRRVPDVVPLKPWPRAGGTSGGWHGGCLRVCGRLLPGR